MQKHGFVGVQSIYTRAILANKKYHMPDFFVGGGAPRICGGYVPPGPPPPRSYAPEYMPRAFVVPFML